MIFFELITERVKGIIFSAGLGTRLQKLTQNCPKALIELNGKPLLWHAINKLSNAGVKQIVVNVHHFANQITDYLKTNNFKAEIYISDEHDSLLDTGGGLLYARPFLEGNSPIIAYNVDVLSSINLQDLVEYHAKHQSLATLVVRQRKTQRYLIIDDTNRLTGWKNTANNDHIIVSPGYSISTSWAFSGIQIISPEIFDLITEKENFPIIPMYLRLAKTHKIMAFRDQSDFWIDCGKPDQLPIGEKWLNENMFK